ncbi:heme-degrading monooxygenase IsdG [Bacillus sp. AFS018417]|uniref:heme oxygenase n=1 Tax=Bacillus sp. AFS018417 TaxID=2033491 RepID=UPI000BF91DD6|nr:heme oxygenase [Bacillus sp. AFS018417]PEZ06629.1 heme-degrading monooxygenase IsdG [Bacillus sp. AFS018417]
MIVVTNRIKTKVGFAEKMAPAFTRPGALQKMEGFVKVEILLTQNLTEHDEISVNTYWEDMESFMNWKNSDAFKQAHKRPESGSQEAQQESPILGNQIVVAEVAGVMEALPAK